jgi:hypothetical protein
MRKSRASRPSSGLFFTGSRRRPKTASLRGEGLKGSMTRPGPETSHSGGRWPRLQPVPLAFLQDPTGDLRRVLGAFQQATELENGANSLRKIYRPAVYPPRVRSSARGLPEDLLQPPGGLLPLRIRRNCRTRSGIPEGDPLGAAALPELRPAPTAWFLSSWPGSERGPSRDPSAAVRRRSGSAPAPAGSEKLGRICRRSGSPWPQIGRKRGSAAIDKANDREIVPAAAIVPRASKNARKWRD